MFRFTNVLIFLALSSFHLLFGQVEWAIKDKSEGWTELNFVKQYNRNNDIQRLWAEQALSNFPIAKDDVILDFGSGDGKVASSLSFKVPQGRVVGVDISDVMIMFSSAKYHFHNLQFVNSDLPSFSENSFSVVTSFSVMHLLPNPLEELTQLGKLLVENGRILLVYPSGDPSFLRAAKITMDHFNLKMPNSVAKDGHLRIRNMSEASIIMKQAGFTDVSSYEINERIRFVDVEDFVSWARGTLTINWGIPHEIEDEFYMYFVARYQEIDAESMKEDGFFPKLSRIVITAKKSPKGS